MLRLREGLQEGAGHVHLQHFLRVHGYRVGADVLLKLQERMIRLDHRLPRANLGLPKVDGKAGVKVAVQCANGAFDFAPSPIGLYLQQRKVVASEVIDEHEVEAAHVQGRGENHRLLRCLDPMLLLRGELIVFAQLPRKNRDRIDFDGRASHQIEGRVRVYARDHA
eukprot:scaffold1798_cov248-Pinguiococcus_pyrenoidosus.AAC.1